MCSPWPPRPNVARAAAAPRGHVRSASRGARPRGVLRRGRAAGEPEAREPALAFGGSRAATPRTRSRRERTSCAAHGRRSASSTCSSPRARLSCRRATARCTCTRRARASTTTAASARRFGIPEEHIFCELVPNGGAFGGGRHVGAGPDGAARVGHEEAGQGHARARRASARIQAPSDHDRARGRLRRRRAPHRRVRAARRRPGAYASVGMKVLERRAAGHMRPLQGSARGREARRVHEQSACDAMRGFGVVQWRSRSKARSTSSPRSKCGAQPAGRSAGTTPVGHRRRVHDRPAGRSRAASKVAARGEGRVALSWMAGAWRPASRAALKNSAAWQRLRRDGARGRLWSRPTARVSLYNAFTEMGQGCWTILTQFAAEVTGRYRACSARRWTPLPRSAAADDGLRATLFAGNAITSAARKLRAALDAGGIAAVVSAGTGCTADVVAEDTTPLGAPGKVKTHELRLRYADGAARRERLRGETLSPRTTWAAVNPALCAADRRCAAHGPRLRAQLKNSCGRYADRHEPAQIAGTGRRTCQVSVVIEAAGVKTVSAEGVSNWDRPPSVRRGHARSADGVRPPCCR